MTSSAFAPTNDASRDDCCGPVLRPTICPPAVTVTHFIDRVLMRGEGGGPVHGWLTMLTDAIASERQDFEAADRFAAACSVRLAR